jgi:ABC-type molybdate transport system substrate-binding protein
VELARTRFEAANPGKTVSLVSGHPAELVSRVEKGDVPDLLLFLGDTELGLLKRDGHVDFLELPDIGDCRLVLAAPRDAAVTLTTAADLLRSGITSVGMPVPGATSLGSEAKSMLERAKLWKDEKLQKKLIVYQDPRDVLTGLAQGKAKVAFLCDPCLALAVSEEVSPSSLRVALALTGEKERLIRPKAAVHKRSPNSGLARKFVKLLAAEDVAGLMSKGRIGPAAPAAGAGP